jgi:subfamily B ATP-binding cassette protein MsbA
LESFKYLLKYFAPYFKDYKFEFALAITGMILAAVGTTATAWIIKPVLDKIFIEQNQSLLTLLPFAVVIVYAIKGGGTFLQEYYAAYIGQDIVRRIRDKLLGKILSFEMGFFHKFRSGELISRSINDIERIRQVVSTIIPIMIREALTIVTLLLYIFYLNPKMAILAILFLPLTAFPLSKLAKKMKKLSHASQEKLSDLTARLSEIFNNIEIIKANATETYELERFEKENKHIFEINIKATKTTELVSPLMEIVGSLAVALVIMYGGEAVINGEMTVGSFFSFLAALFMLYTPIKRVSKMYNNMQDAIAATERIFALLERDSQIIGTTTPFQAEIRKLSFEKVNLHYADKHALEDISFEVHKGESIALVGNSGGGKSSIVNLLLRFYDVSSGSISFNDSNINNYSLDSLRKSISIVTQRIYIFNDSVAANVAYGSAIDEEKVISCLKQANAWDFIQALDKGIYTKINEFGTNLSGGQRQRIAIARAIYRDPKILIFDEATSALDTKSEQEITQALESISKDKITIVIAHRMKTIENVDKIIVLKEGKVCCIGSKSELLKHCDEFMHLNGLQK